MSRKGYQTHIIETPEGHIAAHYKGNVLSKRAFVFIHGHIDSAMENQSHQIFNEDDSELKFHLDLRCHGSSTRTPTYPTLSERSKDIERFIFNTRNKFPEIDKFYFIGYSQGASTLLYYLLNDFLGKEYIGNTFLFAPRLDLKIYLNWFDKEVSKITELGEEKFDKKYRSKGILSYNKKYVEEFSNTDFYKDIYKLDVTSYLIRGGNDDLISRDEVERLIKLNPKFLKYIEIDGLTHYPTIKQFEMIYGLIVELADADEYHVLESRHDRSVEVDEVLENSVIVKATSQSSWL